ASATEIAAAPPQGAINLHARAIAAADLADAAIAVGACDDDREAAAFAAAARAAGVPVNVIDRPGHCDFAFGSIVNRSPLVVRISTGGDSGAVVLVGAGPGDPELLTLRAVRALQSADVILIDDLVSPEVLDFARREARKMMVGKTGHGPACKQDEINALMVKLARAGK